MQLYLFQYIFVNKYMFHITLNFYVLLYGHVIKNYILLNQTAKTPDRISKEENRNMYTV